MSPDAALRALVTAHFGGLEIPKDLWLRAQAAAEATMGRPSVAERLVIALHRVASLQRLVDKMEAQAEEHKEARHPFYPTKS